ncbi:MAG: ABC transporter permease [Bdellovibrionota bacterium]
MKSNVLTIALQEFRILIRDRQALGLLVVMPLALIVFLTLAMKDVYLSKVGRNVDLAIVATGNCEGKDNVCANLVSELRRTYKDVTLNKPEDSRSKRELDIVLPVDIDKTIEKLKAGTKLQPSEQIQLVFDPALDQSMRAVVQGQLMLALQTVLINRVQAELKEMEDAPVKDIVPNVSRFEGLISERATAGALMPNPIQQTVPAWSLFGMFFIVVPLSNSVIRDRAHGIFRRLLSFPIGRGELLMGKVLPFLSINFLQFCLMFAIGTLILPRLIGIPIELGVDRMWQLALVTLVCSLAATSYGLMVACVARTAEQASAIGALSVVILAVMGGVMIPRFVMPDFMQTVSMISPLYWGLEAYHDVILRQATFAVTAIKLGVLVLFSAICMTVAVLRFRWSEV